jgi:hypothetical protein
VRVSDAHRRVTDEEATNAPRLDHGAILDREATLLHLAQSSIEFVNLD